MKSLITLALAISVHMATGQIIKGSWSLGPDVDFAYAKTEVDGFDFETSSSDLSLSATVGYYVIDNLEIGITTGIFSDKEEANGFESSQTGFFIGPNLEYKVSLSSQFYLPVGAGLVFNSATSEDDDDNEFKLTGISYGLYTGIEFISNNKLGAFLHVGPQFGTLKEDESEVEFDATSFGAGMGFRVYF